MRREYEELAERIAGDVPGLALDWGCGWGQVSNLLLDRAVSVRSFDYRSDARVPGQEPLEPFPEIDYDFSSDPVALPIRTPS